MSTPTRRLLPSASTVILAVAATGLLAPRADGAVTLNSVYQFGATDTAPDGSDIESGLTLGTDGNFYGVTRSGGAAGLGTIFKLTPDGTLTTLHSFSGPEGSNPSGPLLLATDGNFYGVTDAISNPALDNQGTAYRLTPDGTLTVLHTFTDADLASGVSPVGALVEGPDGNFYGVTGAGGVEDGGDDGTIFKLTPNGTLTTLHALTRGEGGGPRSGLLLASDGNFYGTTEFNGVHEYGTVFRVALDGTLTVLYAFNRTDGAEPVGGLVEGRDGNFYGTTSADGAAGAGTVFKMTPDGTLTTLHEFNGADGGGPNATLLQGRDGNFYGTTFRGGYADTNFDPEAGTIFEITPQGALTTLRFFDRATAQEFPDDDPVPPGGPLFQAADGSFYGVSSVTGGGMVYHLTPDAAPTTPVVTAAVATVTRNIFPEDTAEVGVLLTFSGTADAKLKVRYSVGGSARPGVDYETLPGKVTVKPGKTTQLIGFTTLANPDAKHKSVIKLRLLPGDGYTVGTPGPLKVKIIR